MNPKSEYFGITNVTSEAACLALAKALRSLVRDLEIHAENLQKSRANYRPIDDKLPALKAVEIGLKAYIAGDETLRRFNLTCQGLRLNPDHIKPLLERKIAAYERERRRKRDEAILKMVRKNVPYPEIARRMGLTKGRISQIVSKEKARLKRARA